MALESKIYNVLAQQIFTCLKLTKETLEKGMKLFKVQTHQNVIEGYSGVFIVNFEHISDFFSCVSIVNFEHVNVCWESQCN